MHISFLHQLVARGEFSLTFVSEDGQLIHVDRCVCTSFHSSGSTMNIKLIGSGEIRKVVRITIIDINGKEVYL